MVKKSKDFLRLMAILLGVGMFVSTAFAQGTATKTAPASVKKAKSSDSTGTKALQANTATSQAPAAAATTGSSVTDSTKIVKNTQTTSSAVPDSVKIKKTIIAVKDSTTKNSAVTAAVKNSTEKDSAVIAVKDSTAKDSAVTAVKDSTAKDNAVTAVKDSTAKDSAVTAVKDSTTKDSVVTAVKDSTAKDSTVVTAGPDSSSAKDSLLASTSTDSTSGNTGTDSSKTAQSSVQVAQAETDTSLVAIPDMNRNRTPKEYINTGLGLILFAGTAGPQVGLIGSLHQFIHCSRPINLRAFFSYIPFSTKFDQTISEQTLGIGISAKVVSGDVLLDFHPFKSGFRLTAGAFFSGSETKAKMESKDGKSIGMITVTPEEMGSLEFSFSRRPVEPYFGIGFGNALKRRVSFLLDLGVAYTGAIQVDGTGTGMIGPSADNAQNLQEVFNKHKELFWWPVVSFGLGIKIF